MPITSNIKNVMKKGNLLKYWRLIVGIAVPILLLPILFVADSEEKHFRAAYVLLLMAIYWVLEPIHIAATSLIPVALFPMLDIASTSDACTPYMESSNMMFIGGLLMALAIEKCNLHKRVALRVLLLVGTSVARIMLGIMLVTAFLSMWISNTATTAMMVPIVDAMLTELIKDNDIESPTDNAEDQAENNNLNKTSANGTMTSQKDDKSAKADKKNIVVRKTLLLSIAYSANIGGTATLTGTGTNLVLQSTYERSYPEATDLTFSSWLIYAFPGMLISVCLAWLLLYILFVRRKTGGNKTQREALKLLMHKKYNELGNLKYEEKAVIVFFFLTVLLWFFRQPNFIDGWAEHIAKDNKISDATPVILVCLIMFLVPSNWKQLRENNFSRPDTLLTWQTVQKKMPWGVVILLGGGFSLAAGIEKAKLSDWLTRQLSSLEGYSVQTVIIVLTISACAITQFASNVATASVILPVVDKLAVSMDVHPLKFMIPITIAVSFAFMFPVATIFPGLLMSILCIAIEIALINSWALVAFNMDQLPYNSTTEATSDLQRLNLFYK